MRARTFFLFIFLLFGGLIIHANWPADPLSAEENIDRIIVEKRDRKMHVLSNGRILKTYPIALGFSPEGHKEKEGDGRTPEGVYTIDSKNPHSGYHLNLGISYPNAADRERAERVGEDPGGEIKIHGLRNGTGLIGKLHRWKDWTLGCIAVTNDEIEELYEHVPIGTVIEIRE